MEYLILAIVPLVSWLGFAAGKTSCPRVNEAPLEAGPQEVGGPVDPAVGGESLVREADPNRWATRRCVNLQPHRLVRLSLRPSSLIILHISKLARRCALPFQAESFRLSELLSPALDRRGQRGGGLTLGKHRRMTLNADSGCIGPPHITATTEKALANMMFPLAHEQAHEHEGTRLPHTEY